MAKELLPKPGGNKTNWHGWGCVFATVAYILVAIGAYIIFK